LLFFQGSPTGGPQAESWHVAVSSA